MCTIDNIMVAIACEKHSVQWLREKSGCRRERCRVEVVMRDWGLRN